MTPIQWQESVPAKHAPPPSAPAAGNHWFTVAVGLMGVIVGFGISSWRTGSLTSGSAPQQVIQAPAPLPSPPAAQEPVPPVDPEKDHIRGDVSKATVAVIEYSDFECPFCKRVHPTYKQILQTYGDKVVWVYRHFPLSFHLNAHKEDEASECVAELGGNDAFWKFTDYVFDKTTSNGTGFPLDQLAVAAKEAGVDAAKFQNCLDSGKYIKHVDDDLSQGQAAGVQGTPANFIVNLKTQKSKLISGALPFASFQSAIDASF